MLRLLNRLFESMGLAVQPPEIMSHTDAPRRNEPLTIALRSRRPVRRWKRRAVRSRPVVAPRARAKGVYCVMVPLSAGMRSYTVSGAVAHMRTRSRPHTHPHKETVQLEHPQSGSPGNALSLCESADIL